MPNRFFGHGLKPLPLSSERPYGIGSLSSSDLLRSGSDSGTSGTDYKKHRRSENQLHFHKSSDVKAYRHGNRL